MAVVIQNSAAGRTGRVLRRPSHTWQVRSKPYQIQPIAIAPVLPGETMKNMSFQARVVTDPIRNPLIGWWSEYYWFYVKHRDLDEREDFVEMVLDANKDMSSVETGSASAWAYHRANSIHWVEKCLKRVVEEYFRDEGETWNAATVDNVPLAAVDTQNVLHSAILQSAMTSFDIDLTDAGSPGGTDVLASEIDAAMRQWEFLRANNLTTMDYEQFLATYGVRAQAPELHVPELIRYIREWSYPTNTIDPETGSPSSAVSWAISERADKDRYFREPGFIFGVSVVRPKTYRRNQRSAAVELLDNAFAWLPAILAADPATSLKPIAANDGPFGGTVNVDHVVDVKDLYIYGDQFLNFGPGTVGDDNTISVPSASLAKRYATAGDIQELFTDLGDPDAEPEPIPPTHVYIRQDGVAQLTIAGTQVDTTPASGTQRLPV